MNTLKEVREHLGKFIGEGPDGSLLFERGRIVHRPHAADTPAPLSDSPQGTLFGPPTHRDHCYEVSARGWTQLRHQLNGSERNSPLGRTEALEILGISASTFNRRVRALEKLAADQLPERLGAMGTGPYIWRGGRGEVEAWWEAGGHAVRMAKLSTAARRNRRREPKKRRPPARKASASDAVVNWGKVATGK